MGGSASQISGLILPHPCTYGLWSLQSSRMGTAYEILPLGTGGLLFTIQRLLPLDARNSAACLAYHKFP